MFSWRFILKTLCLTHHPKKKTSKPTVHLTESIPYIRKRSSKSSIQLIQISTKYETVVSDLQNETKLNFNLKDENQEQNNIIDN
jgi:hypothetical protein